MLPYAILLLIAPEGIEIFVNVNGRPVMRLLIAPEGIEMVKNEDLNPSLNKCF